MEVGGKRGRGKGSQSVAASNNGTRVRFDDKIWRAMQLRASEDNGPKGKKGLERAKRVEVKAAPATAFLALHRLTPTGASLCTGAASYDLPGQPPKERAMIMKMKVIAIDIWHSMYCNCLF